MIYLGYAFLACVFLAVIGIALAERQPVTEEDGATPEAPFLPKDFKPAQPIKRKRYPRTPDRVLRGIHEREQAHHG